MNEITIGETALTVKEYQGKRVVTFRDIDTVHSRPEGTARRNFNTNKEHFIEGEDFWVLNQPNEIRSLGIARPQGGVPESVTLITESGYLMLVKSFTDDLAWTVQRQLVNCYFRAVQTGSVPDVQLRKLEVQEQNAKTRTAQLLLRMTAVDTLSQAYKSILVSKAAEVLTGVPVLPLPESEQKMYSATEIGEMFGVSAQKIGKLSNAYGLKTDAYGQWYHDKSPYSSKEVDSFRYNDAAVTRFREILNGDAE
jgi:hypothetical protein